MSVTEDIEVSTVGAVEPKIIEQPDDFNEPEPTAEELSTLEHISDHIPLAAWLIVVCEFCERFAFYGLSGLWQNYIQFPLPTKNETQPGALDRGQQTATALTMFFRFFAYITPIAGAILADQLWGKYKTIMISCAIYMIGLVVLLLTSIPPAIDKGIAFPGLIVAMIIIGTGTGGVKSNVSPLMAEQYSRTKPIITVNMNNYNSNRPTQPYVVAQGSASSNNPNLFPQNLTNYYTNVFNPNVNAQFLQNINPPLTHFHSNVQLPSGHAPIGTASIGIP
ncbi:unnamed protein product, partial [Rotaria sordida]